MSTSTPVSNSQSSHPTSPLRTNLASAHHGREDSADGGTLSPVSSKSAGTDTANIAAMEQQNHRHHLHQTESGSGLVYQGTGSGRRKRYPSDRPYYISKEILMTERTYKKDLEVLNLWFRDEVSQRQQQQHDVGGLNGDLGGGGGLGLGPLAEEPLLMLFSHLDPIYEVHCGLLRELEHRIAAWEGRGGDPDGPGAKGDQDGGGDWCRKIGDVLLCTFDVLTMDHYIKYLDAHGAILERLELAVMQDTKFHQLCRDFEQQKVCYLPLTTLVLKPLHRILHYELLLERLLCNYDSSHPDYQSTNMAMIKMQTIIRKMANRLRESENFVKLAELQRDLGCSFEGLVQPDREFLREGCLQKLSRKGYQQRMFLLFSDILLYANRANSPSVHFRVHGQLQVRDLSVLDSEPRLGGEHCFNVYDGKKALLVAADSLEDKLQWMEDIAEAAQIARAHHGVSDEEHARRGKFTSLKSMSGSDDGLDRSEASSASTTLGSASQQRTNSSVHVCWHRTAAMTGKGHRAALQTLLSGYLLRKFKNSNGWQKLWVVFTNSCLYFFKTFQDDFPLASLPLLGYWVLRPDPHADDISKDLVFKLQFKNHVYFFRAESQYTFERWVEVLGTATSLSDELAAEMSTNNEAAAAEMNGDHY